MYKGLLSGNRMPVWWPDRLQEVGTNNGISYGLHKNIIENSLLLIVIHFCWACALDADVLTCYSSSRRAILDILHLKCKPKASSIVASPSVGHTVGSDAADALCVRVDEPFQQYQLCSCHCLWLSFSKCMWNIYIFHASNSWSKHRFLTSHSVCQKPEWKLCEDSYGTFADEHLVVRGFSVVIILKDPFSIRSLSAVTCLVYLLLMLTTSLKPSSSKRIPIKVHLWKVLKSQTCLQTSCNQLQDKNEKSG